MLEQNITTKQQAITPSFLSYMLFRYTTPGPYTDSLTGTTTLLGLIKPHVASTPLIAAGGIMTGQQLLAALAAGAAGVQLGTAFLTCDEAGTSAIGKEMLLQEHDRGTALTQVRVAFALQTGVYSVQCCSIYRRRADLGCGA